MVAEQVAGYTGTVGWAGIWALEKEVAGEAKSVGYGQQGAGVRPYDDFSAYLSTISPPTTSPYIAALFQCSGGSTFKITFQK